MTEARGMSMSWIDADRGARETYIYSDDGRELAKFEAGARGSITKRTGKKRCDNKGM